MNVLFKRWHLMKISERLNQSKENKNLMKEIKSLMFRNQNLEKMLEIKRFETNYMAKKLSFYQNIDSNWFLKECSDQGMRSPNVRFYS